MWERLSASWDLAKSSWDVLRREKQLIVFPILSGLGCLLVLASFAIPLAVMFPGWNQLQRPQGWNVQVEWPVYVVAFAFYFCNYFVIIFCNAALVSCALMSFNGERPTVARGFQAAASRLPQIFAWALVSATVGLLLKAIENAHEKAGQLISALLGTAWTVMTFFVVPVLVVEKVGPFQAIGRSISILRKTWGEALAGRLGLGFIIFLLLLPGIGIFALGAAAMAANAWLGFVLMAFAAVYFLGWMAASSALHGIFQSALYQYAAFGEAPTGFDGVALQRVFRRKN